MSMQETLINAGFQDMGLCKMCNNQAKLYNKTVRGSVVEVKVRNDQRKFRLFYRGEEWYGQYSTVNPIEQTLSNVLSQNNFL